MTRYDSKRIAIARAIMYKELAKRNAERELECKRRGLWPLWQYQTRYKTLWHFLRASDDRLIALCDECEVELIEAYTGYLAKIKQLERLYAKNPCNDYKIKLSYYKDLYNSSVEFADKINIKRNKLTGGKNNEN